MKIKLSLKICFSSLLPERFETGCKCERDRGRKMEGHSGGGLLY